MSTSRAAAVLACALALAAAGLPAAAWAQAAPAGGAGLTLPHITVGMEQAHTPGQLSTSLQLLLLFTILSIAPALLIMLTSFTRIVVVLSFLRQAMSTQQMPPNQVLISLALFLTFFIMSPVWNQINTQAVQPLMAGKITQTEAIRVGAVPLREFMLRQTREKDLALFVKLSKQPPPRSASDLPMTTVIPAFMISELRTAFQIGFVIYLPFLIVDMVVASVLMSMGMMMLPPAMISLPFKVLLFVLVDGWHLVIRSLVMSFR
ncbi:MAG TPA: flagellar type III secretion system pore protein FliP [Candidatus Saccharimonadales bacterium]|nr:flagellar type III secretion system pore protein FliP [Candidatus Saccharimonadales bacterium]